MDVDFVIVGSGFGGSVSALRLAEKGYRVVVLEKGRRFGPKDFPKSNWNLPKWLWLPAVGFRGLFKMTFLRHLTALSGVGVGGGSLVYANTLPYPKDAFFEADSWGSLASWKEELDPHYATARRMLGVAKNPHLGFPDEVIRGVGKDLGREEYFEPTDVAVYFGESGVTAPDPYFDGEGPERTGCIFCGACMIGCPHNAKNTLDKNYLYLAEKRGVEIRPDTEVTWVKPVDDGYEVTALEGRSAFRFRRTERKIRTRQVVFSGGVLGTVQLLLKLKQHDDGLPKMSDKLGEFVRTNSEVLMGVVGNTKNPPMSEGIAISSILHTDDHSHVEPVRYPSGSGFFRLLATPHAAGSNVFARLLSSFLYALRHPWKTLKAWLIPDWAKHTMIMLYMRTIDGHLRLKLGRGVRTAFKKGLATERSVGPAPSASIPEADEVAEKIAARMDGVPQSMITETLLGIPTTAHILGGCVMGASADEGVIDAQHRMFGYDGLYVIDGSAISANPGVNPSLTITALAERAMSFIPEREKLSERESEESEAAPASAD